MVDVSIHTEYIQLDQFLKWIGVLDSGAQILQLFEDPGVSVNGFPATQRRKKLYAGDIVSISGVGTWRVIAGDNNEDQ